METKEFKVPIPEGMEIDKEKSTFECIKFKPIESKRWRDDEDANLRGYYVNMESRVEYYEGYNSKDNYNVFAVKDDFVFRSFDDYPDGFDNLVDACVAMIERLHELNLL